MSTLNYIDENGNINKMGVIPQNVIDDVTELKSAKNISGSDYDTLSLNVQYTASNDGILRCYIASGNASYSIGGNVSFTLTGAQTTPIFIKKGTTITILSMDNNSDNFKFYPYK